MIESCFRESIDAVLILMKFGIIRERGKGIYGFWYIGFWAVCVRRNRYIFLFLFSEILMGVSRRMREGTEMRVVKLVDLTQPALLNGVVFVSSLNGFI